MNKHTYIVDRSFKGLHDTIWNPRRLLMTSSSFLFWLCMMYEHVCVCECRHSTCVELRNQPYIIFLTFYLLASGYSRLLDKLPKILLPTPPVMKSTHVQYHAQLYMCNTMPSITCVIHAQLYKCNTMPSFTCAIPFPGLCGFLIQAQANPVAQQELSLPSHLPGPSDDPWFLFLRGSLLCVPLGLFTHCFHIWKRDFNFSSVWDRRGRAYHPPLSSRKRK